MSQNKRHQDEQVKKNCIQFGLIFHLRKIFEINIKKILKWNMNGNWKLQSVGIEPCMEIGSALEKSIQKMAKPRIEPCALEVHERLAKTTLF